MGYLAASGGYWISTYGDRIFAEPNTITGSIGVYGLLPNIQQLAAEHGVTWDGIQTSKLADPTTITRPKTPLELARVQAMVDGIYDQFLTRVSASRKMSKDRVNEIAQGRVWSGLQAQKLGLVDELGGIQDAVRYAAKRAQIEGDYRVDGPGESHSLVERMLRLMSSGDDHGLSESRGAAAELRGWFEQVQGGIQALNDPRGIYARMPYDLNLR